MIYLEKPTQHTFTFGQRIFRVVNGCIEYAYAKDLLNSQSHARWFGFTASIPSYLEVSDIDTAIKLAKT